jgi:hypothetical protein
MLSKAAADLKKAIETWNKLLRIYLEEELAKVI